MIVRKVKLEDASQIAEIYNHYIQNTHHTFETEPLTDEEMGQRILETSENYPYLVAEENGEIYGYVYADKFRLRQAYDHTVEVSIYVKNAAKQKGIGTALYGTLFDLLAETNVHSIVAGISLPNEPSIKFHTKMGFSKVALFREIGYKLGRWIDVSFWELMNRV
jgi:phosphinothricin acetyltransferase